MFVSSYNALSSLNNLPEGNYAWGVQTINAGYEGSTFADGGTFKIGEGGVEGNIADATISITANGGVLTVVAADGGVVEVYAADGALVEKVDFNGSADITLATGYYIVKVATAAGTKVQKIVL